MSKPVETFMSLFEPNWSICQEAKFQGIEKMLWEMAVSPLILYIGIRGGYGRKVHGIHWWRIREAGESKAGESLRSDKE